MATTTAAPGNAAARVFAVPELLENILIYLPPVEIYQSQRINRTFNATISGSPQLHEKMHLENADNEAIETLLFDPHVEDAVHPFELFTMRCFLERDQAQLRRLFKGIEDFDIVFVIRVKRGDSEEQISRVQALKSTEEVASWRKIKIGGPGQKVLVRIDYEFWNWLHPKDSVIVLGGGVTYGELITCCVEKFGAPR